MEDFSDLNSLHQYLEEHSADFQDSLEIRQLFQKLRDKLHRLNDTEGAKQAQWEIDAFSFIARDGQLGRQIEYEDEKGNRFDYPNFDRFDEEAYNYFGKCLLESKELVLRARYAHLLWQSPKKHHKYAQIAVETYLQLIPIYESKDSQHPEEYFGRALIEVIQSAFLISLNSNKIDPSHAKNEIFRLIRNFAPTSSYWAVHQHDFLKLLLDNKEHLQQSEIEEVVSLCNEAAEKMSAKGNFHHAVGMWQLGQSVDKKFQKTAVDWDGRIAQAFEAIMLSRKSEPMAAEHFCGLALKYYRKTKNTLKISELEKKRAQFAKGIKLGVIKTKVDLTEVIQHSKQVASEIAQRPSEQILEMLAHDNVFLPDIEDVKSFAKESLKNFPLQALMPTTIVDDRKNTLQHVVTAEEKERFEVIKTFGFHLEFEKIHLINEVILAAAKAGKLNEASVTAFFEKYSWMGEALQVEIASGQKLEYNWLDLLKPGLWAYLEALQLTLAQKDPSRAIVLAIDSLVLKFEGLIRELCQLNGAITTFDARDNNGRILTLEADITRLLHEGVLEKILSPVDLLFLQFLLIEHAGLKLRHNVAHCFLRLRNYELVKVHLIFLGILRLSKFKIRKD